NPRASLIRSLGVSCTEARVSLWGLLTRTVTATSAPINSARRTMANTRRPIGIVATGVPVANRSSCPGLVLTLATWCLPCARREGLRSFVMVSRVRPDGQLLLPSGQHCELLGCGKFVQTVNADLNRLGVVVGDTVDAFGAAHDRLQVCRSVMRLLAPPSRSQSHDASAVELRRV